METKQIFADHKFSFLSSRHPWFIAHNLESDTQIFYTIDNMQYSYECRFTELQGRRIQACFHGWLILSDQESVLWSLWNPLTSKLIHLLPLINEDQHSYECCLSAPPDDEGSFLLLTKAKVPTVVLCRLDCNRKWIEISYDEQLKSIRGADESFLEISCSEHFSNISGLDDCFLERPTCCNGKIYAMTMGPCYTFVIQVDVVVKGEEVWISLTPFVEIPKMSFNRCPAHNTFYNIDLFLKGSGKDLFCIGVCFLDETMIGNVYLFKLDFTSMMWEEMVDLKDAIFFLELASGYKTCYYDFVVNSEGGGYVHILGESGKIIYSYHAKDRTMSVSSTPRVVQESQAFAWAMLEWRLEIDHVESKEEDDSDTGIVVTTVKGDESEFDIITGESHLLHIPVDVLKMIMEHCIGSEYMRFRATCKLCHSIAPTIVQWSSKTTLRKLQMYSLGSPLLMVFDNYRGIITFIDPTRDDRYFIKIPQELKGDYQIYCSKYGWVLMYQICGRMVFFNPFTGNILELPPKVPYLQSFCFSAPPTSPDCMVVGFTDHEKWSVFVHFVSREPVWYNFRLNFGGDDPYSYYFPTFIGRDVYALCNNKGLHVFRDIAEDDLSWEVVVDEAAISGCKSPARYFLSNCDQHSLLVIVGQFGESVEVFKATDSSEKWEKIDKLGKHMIYISDTSCICLEAKSPEMENKIYFPRLLHNNETKMVFYSLETCKFHTFDGKNIQESFAADLFGTKHLCCPHTWIEPSWS